ncbi:MAG: ComEA family DNA-binding protein [Gemmatimonadaceae bacterium]
MATPAERKALLFLTGLLLLGGVVRVVRAVREAPVLDEAARRDLRLQIAAVDSARRVAANARARRRSAKGEGKGERGARKGRRGDTLPPVDLDRASAAEIERLPRIGPALAQRIVADRDSLGPFGSLERFQRVRGVGPVMAKVLAPHVTFSLPPRQPGVNERGGGARAAP